MKSTLRSLALAVSLAAHCAGKRAAGVQDRRAAMSASNTVATGLSNPWGLAFPAGRPHAGDRAAGPHAHRDAATASCRRPLARRAEGLVAAIRAGCSTSSSTATSQRTTRSISAIPIRSAAARRPRWRAPGSMRATTPQLIDVQRIFRQEGPPSGGLHFGCRIVQARDGNLFLTTGDHYSPSRSRADSRQSSRQGDPHRARRLGAEGQSVRRPAPVPSRRSGATAIATARVR